MSHYVVLDLEMCHLHKKCKAEEGLYSEIIQIGAVLLNDTYDIADSFMTYVKPSIGHTDQFITQLTGISDTHLHHAPDLKKALELMIKWLPEDVVIVTWSEHDEEQMRKEIEIKNIEIDDFDVYFSSFLDCQKLFNEKVGRDKNYKLSEALCVADIDRDSGDHDALIDAKNTSKLFKKLMSKEKFQFNDYYMPANDIRRSSYNPFLELLTTIKIK